MVLEENVKHEYECIHKFMKWKSYFNFTPIPAFRSFLHNLNIGLWLSVKRFEEPHKSEGFFLHFNMKYF